MPTRHEASPVDVFNTYQGEQASRLLRLGNTLSEGLELVSNLSICNQKLTEAGREDLLMTQQATMKPYNSVDNFPNEANNFTPGFQFTGRTGENRQSLIDESKLEQLRKGLSHEEVFGFKYIDSTTHVGKPAFYRMLILFSDFSDRFILDFSKPLSRDWGEFMPELFVAYQLMSRLVDINDEHVMEDGKIDSWYLCH